jgi:predicted transcriptional regulator
MLAATIASKALPQIQFTDKVAFVLQCMEDFDVQHLPVVKDDYYSGLISKETLLDSSETETIANLADTFLRIAINEKAHFLTALSLFTKHHISLLPVVNEQQETIGVVLQENLNELLAQFLGVDMPGATIVLAINPYQYSLAEMSRLVETNNAQILHLNASFDEATGNLIVTLKINKEEAAAIIATFQRYNYQVLHYFGNSPIHDDIEEHYQHLMNYLDV